MANLGKIVYLSEAQKDELFANGTVTSNGTTITYSANDLYVTPDNLTVSNSLGDTSTTNALSAAQGRVLALGQQKLNANLGIIQDANVATQNISRGQYVIWKGDLYQASSAIASGTTLSSSNLTAKSNGLGGEIESINNDIVSINSRFGVVGNWTSVDAITYPGIFYVDDGTLSGILVVAINGSYARQIFISDDGTTHTVRSYNGSSWGTAHSF